MPSPLRDLQGLMKVVPFAVSWSRASISFLTFDHSPQAAVINNQYCLTWLRTSASFGEHEY
jgi:hypothetical protein